MGERLRIMLALNFCNVTESLWKSRSTAIWPANPITVACDFAIRTIILHAASEALRNQGAELVIDGCRFDGIELSVFPDYCCLRFSSRRVVLLAGVLDGSLTHQMPP
jgi:hypothetical protein